MTAAAMTTTPMRDQRSARHADRILQQRIAENADAEEPARRLERQPVAQAPDLEEGQDHLVEDRDRGDREQQQAARG